MNAPWLRACIACVPLLLVTVSDSFANGHWGRTETVYAAPTAAVLAPTSYVYDSAYVLPTVYSSSVLSPTYYVSPTAYVAPTAAYVAPTAYYATSYVVPRRWRARGYYATSYYLPTSYYEPTSYYLPSSYYLPTSYYLPSSYYLPTTYSYYPTVYDYPVITSAASSSECCSTMVAAAPAVASPSPYVRKNVPAAPAEAEPSAAAPREEPGYRQEDVPPPSSAVGKSKPVPPVVESQPAESEMPAAPNRPAPPENEPASPPEVPAVPKNAKPVPPMAPRGDANADPLEFIPKGAEFRREARRPVLPGSYSVQPKIRTVGNILEGVVKSSKDGQREEGVRVIVSSRTGAYDDRVSLTNAYGRFAIRLPDGDWTVKVATASGRVYPVYDISVSEGQIVDEIGKVIPSLWITR